MKLKAGIIGLGVGEAHIEGYNAHPDCNVVALCDFADEKLSIAKKKYPDVKITNRVSEVLKDPQIDIVSIASYDNYHCEQILEAVENDKHVFVEKPICLYENEATRIRNLLKAKPQLKMSSNLILRKSPRFQLLKRLVSKGDMGQLFYVEGDYNYGRLHKITEGWRGKLDFYSVVYGGGIHIIDLLLWLTGDDIIEVASYGTDLATKQTNFQYNDMVVCILKFRSGIIGKMAVNFSCVSPHFHALSLYGTKASFINGLEHGMLFESRDPKAGYKKITETYKPAHKGDLIYNFVDSILKQSHEEISQEEIFKSMSVCFAIEKAVLQSSAVPVNYI